MSAAPRLAAALGVLGVLALLGGCSLFGEHAPEYAPVVLPSGVLVQEVVVPEEGPVAREGDRVVLHYEIRLTDGTLVDSSFDRGQPLESELGSGPLPPGLEEGVLGMRRFGRRRVFVPAALAYGAGGRPPRIPPDADLQCVLELMDLELGP